jgi:hypothetical protein
VAGASLTILFRYRDFGPDAAPRRSVVGWTQTRLQSFSPDRAGQRDAAMLQLRRAYRENLGQFAQAATRPPRAHRHN